MYIYIYIYMCVCVYVFVCVCVYFHIYKNVKTAKYYQENKVRLKKKPVKYIEIFLKKEKKRNNNMLVNVT